MNFYEDLKVGKMSEKRFEELYKKYINPTRQIIDVSMDKEYQAKSIDFITKSDKETAYIEVKSYSHDCGFLYLEICNLDNYNPGWWTKIINNGLTNVWLAVDFKDKECFYFYALDDLMQEVEQNKMFMQTVNSSGWQCLLLPTDWVMPKYKFEYKGSK